MTTPRVWVLAAATAGFCVGAWANQSGVPKTPAGARFTQFLEAFNSGNKDKINAFHRDTMPAGTGRSPEEMTEMVLGFYKEIGGFDVVGVAAEGATRLTARLKERNSGNQVRLVLEVEPEAPHKVANINLGPGDDEKPREPVKRVSEAEAVAAAKTEAERLAGEGGFAGAVLVAKGDTVLWKQAYGEADRTTHAANRTDTKFNLGSMNKMFTAVAVAQLAQAGKLRFDDPVGKHLKGYPNQDVATKVTIHHLLTHTGGTGDIFGPEFEKNLAALKTPGDYVKLYGNRGPAYEPGARHAYSNYGFVLLGAIIESVSGMDYYEYVAKKIFAPAGMKDTASYWKDRPTENMATGYTKRRGEVRDNAETRPMRGSPAGGGYSTVEDLHRFARALMGYKLLDEVHTKLVTEGKVKAPMPGVQYAYGFMDWRQDGVRWVGHGGGAPGINADLRMFPETGYVVAVGANLDPPAAQRISGYVAERLPGK